MGLKVATLAVGDLKKLGPAPVVPAMLKPYILLEMDSIEKFDALKEKFKVVGGSITVEDFFDRVHNMYEVMKEENKKKEVNSESIPARD